mgnify:CR=1 FL=1
MIKVGISAFYHDSAAALIIDGKIIAAAQEERFSRKKHDDFNNKYREVDVLLVDDIQFLANKTQSQNEFFKLFESLHGTQKQIVTEPNKTKVFCYNYRILINVR